LKASSPSHWPVPHSSTPTGWLLCTRWATSVPWICSAIPPMSKDPTIRSTFGNDASRSVTKAGTLFSHTVPVSNWLARPISSTRKSVKCRCQTRSCYSPVPITWSYRSGITSESTMPVAHTRPGKRLIHQMSAMPATTQEKTTGPTSRARAATT